MGEVRRATDEVLGREVAVKLMLPVPQTLAASQRFLREARATARIRSPHVVAAYDFGEYGDGYYLAMELVTGCSVADELRRDGLFTAERAEQVIRQAAAGLAAVHRHGIVHRDVKTSNLLLAVDGTVKIADFGIVRFLNETTTTLTATGQIVGTSHYLAPERALGRPAEPPADVYALGCVLYQLVTGRPPFLADSPALIMYQHVQTDPVPPSELRPELAGLEPLISWLLDKDPARRPTAAQLAQGAQPPAAADTPVRRRRARPVLAGVAAAIALVAATVGILLEIRGVNLPATNDLSPGDAVRTTPTAPVAPRTTAFTSKPSSRPSAGPNPPAPAVKARDTSKAGKSGAQAGKPDEPGKPGAPPKPKKPKP
ncbi:serine/threonine protein kinase [Kribbella turkmenica]|uniref:non-specific serine/threonine protein kinase n=2 Tax=Kribbella turkmenica TaxID=2530375 RepID=A0A4V2YEA5_9ACTN|nr:serine/threonine protein kinase [Kribbella turkmenica]